MKYWRLNVTHRMLKIKKMQKPPQLSRAFTLIELLVVITIIAILMALLFPAFRGVQDQAKRAQAKNDLTQIVTAINAFYTEYGQYPCGAQPGGDANDYFAGEDSTEAKLFTDLRGISGFSDPALNSRMITFIQAANAKNLKHAEAKAGICENGHFHDPWGGVYRIKMDNNYNNQLENPYSSNAGFGILNAGVIAWSLGKDLDGAKTTKSGGDKKTGVYDDDVVSWQ